jgi:HPt (histidine-containing phosphotransfer) domain-containing protein
MRTDAGGAEPRNGDPAGRPSPFGGIPASGVGIAGPGSAVDASSGLGEPPPPARAPVAEERPALPEIRSTFEDDPDLAELVARFVGSLPSRSEVIGRVAAEEQWEELVRLAHQLKGSAGGYGLPMLGEVASRLEQAAKRRDSAESGTLVRELRQTMSRVRLGSEAAPAPG